MTTARTRLWRQAERDLGISIETPFQLELANGSALVFDVLVKEFGAKNGTLLADDYSYVEKHAEEILSRGYTFSVYLQPNPTEMYDRDSYIEMLSEWGWCGPQQLRPRWLLPQIE
jgi:hypothetical protein